MTTKTPVPHRWLYGANLAGLVLIALALLAFVCYLTQYASYRKDITSGQVYSLSPATRALLRELDDQHQSYELTYIEAGAATQADLDNARRLRDLLQEYVRNSHSIKLYAPESRDDFNAHIRERYLAETKPYDDLLNDFAKPADELEKFYKSEALQFGQLAQQPGLAEEEQRLFTSGQAAFATLLPEKINKRRNSVKSLTESTVPEYSKAIALIKDLVDSNIAQIDPLADPAQFKAASKPVQAYLTEAHPRYQKILETLKQYKARLDKLPPLKMDEAIESSVPGSVVLFTPHTVKTIPPSDLLKLQRNAPETDAGPAYSFEGEQAISSALIPLVRPDKPKIVFVSGGTPNLTTTQYSGVTDRLTKANFEVLDWAVPGASPNPDQPPTPATPPASGKGVVWIIFPPEAPNPQMLMMGMPPTNPAPLIEAVKKHLDAGGHAMFLAEAAAPSPFSPGAAPGYPFADLLKPFGIDVQANYTVVKAMARRDGTKQAIPQIPFNRFPEHPITTPVQSLETIFFAGQTRMGLVGAPTVVGLASVKPAAVEASLLVRIDDPDVWGESNMTTPKPAFDPKTVLKGPIPMGAAAVKNPGRQDAEQRIVVFGSKLFPSNAALEEGENVLRSDGIAFVPYFPGNSELFTNSILWLSGYKNMIATTPNAAIALRIRPISPAALLWIDWGILYLGLPSLALLAGAFVFFVRRH